MPATITCDCGCGVSAGCKAYMMMNEETKNSTAIFDAPKGWLATFKNGVIFIVATPACADRLTKQRPYIDPLPDGMKK